MERGIWGQRGAERHPGMGDEGLLCEEDVETDIRLLVLRMLAVVLRFMLDPYSASYYIPYYSR